MAVIVNITVQQVGSEWFNVALDYTGNSQFPYGLAAATTHWPGPAKESKLPWNRAVLLVCAPFFIKLQQPTCVLVAKLKTWVDPSTSKYSRRVCNLKGRKGKIDKKKKWKRKIRSGKKKKKKIRWNERVMEMEVSTGTL